MPTAVREQVAVLAKAALATLAGVNALREYYDEIDTSSVPAAILFEWDGHRIDPLATGEEQVTMPIMVVGVVKAASAEAAATAANDLHARIVGALTTNTDLLERVEDVRERELRGPRMEAPESSAEYFAAFEVEFEIVFARAENDAFSFG